MLEHFSISESFSNTKKSLPPPTPPPPKRIKTEHPFFVWQDWTHYPTLCRPPYITLELIRPIQNNLRLPFLGIVAQASESPSPSSFYCCWPLKLKMQGKLLIIINLIFNQCCLQRSPGYIGSLKSVVMFTEQCMKLPKSFWSKETYPTFPYRSAATTQCSTPDIICKRKLGTRVFNYEASIPMSFELICSVFVKILGIDFTNSIWLCMMRL